MRSIKSIRCSLDDDDDDGLSCLLYPAGMEAVRMAMWVVCAILTYEEGAVWVPKPPRGRLGELYLRCLLAMQRGFVLLSFDMECIKGGCFVLFGGCDKKSKNDILRSISINTNRVVTANLSRSQDKPALIRTVTGPILVVFQGFI